MRTVTGACTGRGIASATAFAAARAPSAEDGGVVTVAIKISTHFTARKGSQMSWELSK
jgi:hypothetical protein